MNAYLENATPTQTLIDHWKQGNHWCSDKVEAKKKLDENPELVFAIWSSERDATKWGILFSENSKNAQRVSKDEQHPVAWARCLDLKSRDFFADEDIDNKIQRVLLKKDQFSETSMFYIREASDKKNPLEFTLGSFNTGKNKIEKTRFFCEEEGYRMGQQRFTQLTQLLSTKNLQVGQSVNIQEKMEKELAELNPASTTYIPKEIIDFVYIQPAKYREVAMDLAIHKFDLELHAKLFIQNQIKIYQQVDTDLKNMNLQSDDNNAAEKLNDYINEQPFEWREAILDRTGKALNLNETEMAVFLQRIL